MLQSVLFFYFCRTEIVDVNLLELIITRGDGKTENMPF